MLANLLITPATVMAAGGPGTPPELANDTINATEDQVATGNVLANDTNSSGVVPFTVTSWTQPAPSVGTLTIAANGNYTFTPATDFTGSGTATYMASNTKHEVGPATITINVAPAQDPPSAGDDTVSVDEDTPTDVTSAILANDSDPENDAISITAVSNVSGGDATLSSGAVTFAPTTDLCGDGEGGFDYTISATGGTDTAHVTVDIDCVNDGPTANDDVASGTEDQDVVVAEADLVANDDDIDGGALSVTDVGNAQGGSVSRAGGDVTFTPDADVCGAASFDYTVSDGNGGSDTGTVDITLDCVQDAPVANDDTASGTEDTDVEIDAASLAANDDDADDDSLDVTDVGNAQHGTVVLDAGTITFTPDPDRCGDGAASFDYTVDDGHGNSDTGTVTIDLECTNDAPVANPDSVDATEDTPADLTTDLLANDTDIDAGDVLSISDYANVTGGTVDLTDGTLTFTPDTDQCGDEYGSFDYQVSDGNGGTSSWASVTVDVSCENDAPVANTDSDSTDEDTPLSIDPADLLANDTDADSGDTLALDSVGSPTHGTVDLDEGQITFVPEANFCGAAGFEYTVIDGNGESDTGTVDVTVDCVNDDPDANDDSANGTEDDDVVIDAADLLTNDEDVDSDSAGFTVSDVGNAQHGTVAMVGTEITFTPDDDVCGDGSASFDYELSDGDGATSTATVWINLDCVNDNPVATDDTQDGTEDTDVVFPAADLLDNDSDVDEGDTLSVGILFNAHGGTVAIESGTITFTPAANVCGDEDAWFDYTLNDDNEGSDTGRVFIHLECVNDAPVAVDDTATVDQDSGPADHEVIANDSDPDGTTPVLTDASTGHGIVALNGTKITFTPTAGFTGHALITYTISDGELSDTGTLDVTVDPVTSTDTTPPTVHAAGVAFYGSGRVDSSAKLKLTWSATDAGSGVASYQVQLSLARKPFVTIYQGTGTSLVRSFPLNQHIVIRVRATDGDGNVSGWVTSPTHKIKAFQNSNAKVAYTGTWKQVRWLPASGNGYAFSSHGGDKAKLTFKGRSVLYVSPRNKASGYVKVFVDGRLLGRFNLKTEKAQMGRIIAGATWGPTGTHTIRIVNDQNGKRTNFDAFLVLK
jgi:hypothetical protein